ncbi:hypothetical protein ACUSIJ_17780 [Pseudochelatococcus sp. B33]
MTASTTTRRFAAREIAIELERITATTQRTCERWIAAGRMSPEQARRRIAILQAAAADYRRLANKDQHQLFEDGHA